MANSKGKCTGCGDRFPTGDLISLPAGKFHSFECATDYATDKRNKKKIKSVADKVKRQDTKKRKEELRPKSWYVKEAQKWFNKFIRLRDKYANCICCDRERTANIQWHAGHFLTTGARPEHRFNEDNCHKQTSYCNNHLSGNVAEYRKRLIGLIGIERVEALEQDHKPKNYTIDDLKDIIAKYKRKCRELETESA